MVALELLNKDGQIVRVVLDNDVIACSDDEILAELKEFRKRKSYGPAWPDRDYAFALDVKAIFGARIVERTIPRYNIPPGGVP